MSFTIFKSYITMRAKQTAAWVAAGIACILYATVPPMISIAVPVGFVFWLAYLALAPLTFGLPFALILQLAARYAETQREIHTAVVAAASAQRQARIAARLAAARKRREAEVTLLTTRQTLRLTKR